ELLPPLPARGTAPRAGRHLDQPRRLPLRHSHLTVARCTRSEGLPELQEGGAVAALAQAVTQQQRPQPGVEAEVDAAVEDAVAEGHHRAPLPRVAVLQQEPSARGAAEDVRQLVAV